MILLEIPQTKTSLMLFPMFRKIFNRHFPAAFWLLMLTLITLSMDAPIAWVISIYSGIKAAYHINIIRKAYLAR